MREELQIALGDEPFVDGHDPLEGPGAVIGNHHDGGFIGQQGKHGRDLLIHKAIKLGDGAGKGAFCHMTRVVWVVVGPEAVVEAIRGRFHHHEKTPGPVSKEIARNREAAFCRLVQIGQEQALLLFSELLYVVDVFPFGDATTSSETSVG